MLNTMSLSNDVFNSYLTNARSGQGQQLVAGNEVAAIGQARGAAVRNRAVEDKLKEEDMLLQGMQIASQAKGGRGIPQEYTHQQRGYGDIQDPNQFGMDTILPFSEETDKQRNFAGIVGSFNPQVFHATEQMVQQVQAMGPAAAKALAYRGSIYQGVPQDWATNRLYIANTRQRENSIYAFV